jgi:hypothetical protein
VAPSNSKLGWLSGCQPSSGNPDGGALRLALDRFAAPPDGVPRAIQQAQRGGELGVA